MVVCVCLLQLGQSGIERCVRIEVRCVDDGFLQGLQGRRRRPVAHSCWYSSNSSGAASSPGWIGAGVRSSEFSRQASISSRVIPCSSSICSYSALLSLPVMWSQRLRSVWSKNTCWVAWRASCTRVWRIAGSDSRSWLIVSLSPTMNHPSRQEPMWSLGSKEMSTVGRELETALPGDVSISWGRGLISCCSFLAVRRSAVLVGLISCCSFLAVRRSAQRPREVDRDARNR